MALSLGLALAWPVVCWGQPISTYYPRIQSGTTGLAYEIRPGFDPVYVGESQDWTLLLPEIAASHELTVSLKLPRYGVLRILPFERRAGASAIVTIPSLIFERSGVWELVLEIKDTEISAGEKLVFRLSVSDRPVSDPSGSLNRSGDGSRKELWSRQEIDLLSAMALGIELDSPLPGSELTGSALSGSTLARAKLGHLLFFDASLGRSGDVSCATCHRPERAFSSFSPVLARRQSTLDGQSTIDVPGLIGVAENTWFNRNGSKDSLWSQAQHPLENPDEIGVSRTSLIHQVFNSIVYRDLYLRAYSRDGIPEELLRKIPVDASPKGSAAQKRAWNQLEKDQRRVINSVFVNILKSFEAYLQQLKTRPTRFDRYVQHLQVGAGQPPSPFLSDREIAGLKLFIGGKTRCLQCHTGKHFSNQKFHNIGTRREVNQNDLVEENSNIADSRADGFSDTRKGRTRGLEILSSDPFNCLGQFSSANRDCSHLDTLGAVELPYLQMGAFRTPTLRYVSLTAPYMHDGSQNTLGDVIEHYRDPPESKGLRASHELTPVRDLTEQEIGELVSFLKSLTPSESNDGLWYRAPD